MTKGRDTLPVGKFTLSRSAQHQHGEDASEVAMVDQVPIEIQYVYERGAGKTLSAGWQGIQICTRNRMYMLDSTSKCIAVSNAETDKPEEHPLIGASLIGGQVRDAKGKVIEVSQPLPRLGAQALFAVNVGGRVSFSETSPVTKVVFRQRIVTIDPNQPDVDWDDATCFYDSGR